MPLPLTHSWSLTGKDAANGYQTRTEVSKLFQEWGLADDSAQAYRLIHDIVYADGEDDSNFTAGHVRKLQAVINHGYPMYRILLIQKAQSAVLETNQEAVKLP